MRGPLGPWDDALADRLELLGYAGYTIKGKLRLAGELSDFVGQRGMAAADVNGDAVDAFVAQLPRPPGSPDRRVPTAKSFAWIVDALVDLGVAALPAAKPAVLWDDVLIERFATHLRVERGLVVDTITEYCRAARLLLGAAGTAKGLAELEAATVSRFVQDRCSTLKVRAAERLVSGVRSFLRFLLLDGVIVVPLADAVPSVARWTQAELPRWLTPTDVKALLGSCDRDTPVGRRDYAIILLLVRLGLRAGEVAALRLDDINWRAAEIVVRGKGNTEERLPLPADVGAALADYLEHGRQQRPEREVFLRRLAPIRGLAPDGIGEVVRAASERAGIGSFGAHRLRHTAATSMLNAGASLTDVAQVLRHRNVATTAIYAKVDHRRLRRLCVPWPGAVR